MSSIPKLRFSPETFLFLFWVIATLSLRAFHEPWTDEAQAWLVSKNASSLWDLLLRSSIEATGPVYYFLLRPLALLFPNSFPTGLFLLSWTGTALFVACFCRSKWVPFAWRCLVLFGFLIFFEYAIVARLYGWGCLFLWCGICADREDRPTPAAVWFSLACLTQLNFFIATSGWLLFHTSSFKKIKSYWPLLLGLMLMAWQLKLGKEYRDWHWVQWGNWRDLLAGAGTTLSTPWIQGPHIGLIGLSLLPILFYPLSPRARLAFALALAQFIFLFVFRYSGNAQPRHGGPVFILWIALIAHSLPIPKLSYRIVNTILVINLITGLVMHTQNVLFQFSDSTLASHAIHRRALEVEKAPRIYVDKGVHGYAISAYLDAELWNRGEKGGCPFFASECVPIGQRSHTPASLYEGVENCAKENLCVFAQGAFDAPPPENAYGVWAPLYIPERKALKEPIAVYEFRLRAP